MLGSRFRNKNVIATHKIEAYSLPMLLRALLRVAHNEGIRFIKATLPKDQKKGEKQ